MFYNIVFEQHSHQSLSLPHPLSLSLSLSLSRCLSLSQGASLVVQYQTSSSPPDRVWAEQVGCSVVKICWSRSASTNFGSSNPTGGETETEEKPSDWVLCWWPKSSGPQAMRISGISESALDGGHHLVKSLAPCTSYMFTIRKRSFDLPLAASSNNSHQSDEVKSQQLANQSKVLDVTTGEPPRPVGQLHVSCRSFRSITVEWTMPAQVCDMPRVLVEAVPVQQAVSPASPRMCVSPTTPTRGVSACEIELPATDCQAEVGFHLLLLLS